MEIRKGPMGKSYVPKFILGGGRFCYFIRSPNSINLFCSDGLICSIYSTYLLRNRKYACCYFPFVPTSNRSILKHGVWIWPQSFFQRVALLWTVTSMPLKLANGIKFICHLFLHSVPTFMFRLDSVGLYACVFQYYIFDFEHVLFFL